MVSPKGEIEDFQSSRLKEIISNLWNEKGNTFAIDDIANACLADEDRRVKDLGNQLFAFTSRGGYGKYFNKSNSIKFSGDFTVLELDELQGRKHLRQVVLLQLINQIQQEIFLGEVGRIKIVIVDEAWDLLKEGKVGTFMEHAYRKFRKYGGSMGIATQSINDLYENPVGRAIAENSANMLLLGQTEETVESLKNSQKLTLSEGGYNLLKTVRTVSGVFSEIFIKAKHGIGVARLIVSNFQKLLYSTDPNDIAAINKYLKQGNSVPQSINLVLKERNTLHE